MLMFKKSVSIILTVVMLLSVIAVTSVSAGAETDELAPVEGMPTTSEYDLWVGGVPVNSYNADEITGDGISGTVYYDDKEATLYLDNASITGSYNFSGNYSAAIYSGKDVTINLIGKNTVKPSVQNNNLGFACLGAKMTLTGSGSAESYGTMVSTLVIDKGTTLTTNVVANQSYYQIGVMAVNLTVNGTLDATSTSIYDMTPAVVSKNITVNEGGLLKVLAKNGIGEPQGETEQPEGIHLNDDSVFNVYGTVQIEARGSIYADWKNRGYAIHGDSDCVMNVAKKGNLTLSGLEQAINGVDISLDKTQYVIKAGDDADSAKEIAFSNIDDQKYISIQPGTPTVSDKKDNTLTVSTATKTVKASALKKANTVVKPITIKNAKGTITAAKVKNGTTSSIYSKITVNKISGAITFKKGTYKAGTYKVKVSVKAAGNSEYKAKTITKTATIKIKGKDANTVTVSAKGTDLTIPTLSRANKVFKALTIKKAKGTVNVVKVKSGTTAAIYNKIVVNKKTGAITFKRGSYKKGTYKIKLSVTAKGNDDYKAKTVNKTIKIRIANKFVTCSKCKGKGEFTCSNCDGSGRVRTGQTLTIYYNGVPWRTLYYTTACSVCGGDGKIECSQCHGAKTIMK